MICVPCNKEFSGKLNFCSLCGRPLVSTTYMRVVYNTETVKGYMAEQQCLALVRVANVHNTPLSNIRVEYWLQHQKYGEIPLSSLAVDGMEEISLPFVPKDAGQYSLSLRIFCHTEQGDIVELSSALINFQVHHQGAPSNVHIHQTGERVFGNHNIEMQSVQQGNFLGGGSWQELSLKFVALHSARVAQKQMESVENLEKYEKVFEKMVADGVFASKDRLQLEKVRQKLQISPESHSSLLARYRQSPTAVVEIHIPEHSFQALQFGQEQTLSLSIRNTHTDELDLEEITIHYRSVEEGMVDTLTVEDVLSAGEECVVDLEVPLDIVCRHQLRIWVECRDILEDRYLYAGVSVPFFIEAQGFRADRWKESFVDCREERVYIPLCPISAETMDTVVDEDFGEVEAYTEQRITRAREAAARKKAEQERLEVEAERKRQEEERIRQEKMFSVFFHGKGNARHEMVYIPGGTFEMGALEGDEDAYDDETPRHRVTISRDFLVGKYPVTQGLYESVVGSNPSLFEGSTRPVECVSWYDAVSFCNKLSVLEGREVVYTINGDDVSCNFGAKGYRLLTEAEWEYCARSGQRFKYAGSDTVDEVAWYNGNSGGETHPVGLKKPNGFGLYDMSGNIWEWCWDKAQIDDIWHLIGDSLYTETSQEDPQGPTSGSFRVNRGGGWNSLPRLERVSSRSSYSPTYRSFDIGFRLGLSS